MSTLDESLSLRQHIFSLFTERQRSFMDLGQPQLTDDELHDYERKLEAYTHAKALHGHESLLAEQRRWGKTDEQLHTWIKRRDDSRTRVEAALQVLATR